MAMLVLGFLTGLCTAVLIYEKALKRLNKAFKAQLAALDSYKGGR